MYALFAFVCGSSFEPRRKANGACLRATHSLDKRQPVDRG
jgi:hypothetical protein